VLISCLKAYCWKGALLEMMLVVAGALKRVDQEVSEELIMYRTMLDLIKPKLVYLDLPLFMALLSDLFPGVEQPPAPAGALRNAIEADLIENNLQVLLQFE
jgi:dynein heavy chain